MPNLKDKVIAVIGGSTGIGAETARQLAAIGAIVVIGDINESGAETTANAIRQKGGRASAYRTDIADDDSMGALFAGVHSQFGRLDGLHLNAADMSAQTIDRDTDAVDIDLTVWDRTMAVSLRGYLLGIRHAVPIMLTQKRGAIVCTSSHWATAGGPGIPAYTAAKAGVNALVRHVAARWGKQGIRANAVAPGPIMTPERMANTDRREANEAWIKDRLERLRVPRIGQPSDIAAAVRFLLSDEAEYINGQVIQIDGGYNLGWRSALPRN